MSFQCLEEYFCKFQILKKVINSKFFVRFSFIFGLKPFLVVSIYLFICGILLNIVFSVV